jgi:hypothetical protein
MSPLKKGLEIEQQPTYSDFCSKNEAKNHHIWAYEFQTTLFSGDSFVAKISFSDRLLVLTDFVVLP